MSVLSALLRWDAIDVLLGDRARVQGMLDFEAALARAEAREGVIPATAAPAIAAQCSAAAYDLDAIGRGAALAGNLAIPLVRELTARVEAADPKAAPFVHWGATSQDAIDTGLVLQLRPVLERIASELTRLGDALAALVEAHRATPIAGRTWMQHAVPTSFGLKAAGWLDAVLRHQERVADLQRRALVLQFGGAAGNLAALGDNGLGVATALADELRLALPDLPWHAHRDRLAEVATTMGLLAGTLGKMARDVALHGQTEVAELHEPDGPGRGSSSSMPHKRNPLSSAVALAAATRAPGLVASVLSAMVQEDERGLGGWQAEWETLPELLNLVGGALHHLADAMAGLGVDPARMAANLEASRGLVFAEAVEIALAEKTGRAAARRLVEDACRQAQAEGRHLREVLAGEAAVSRQLPAGELARLFDPQRRLGATDRLIDRVLATRAAQRATRGDEA